MKTCDQTLPEEKLVHELQVWPRSLQGGLVLLWIKLSPIWIAGGWQCPEEVNGELVNKTESMLTRSAYKEHSFWTSYNWKPLTSPLRECLNPLLPHYCPTKNVRFSQQTWKTLRSATAPRRLAEACDRRSSTKLQAYKLCTHRLREHWTSFSGFLQMCCLHCLTLRNVDNNSHNDTQTRSSTVDLNLHWKD